MISEKLMSAINDQINYEFYSEFIYLAMAAYCEDLDLTGFANYYTVQAQEERAHAMKFFNYVNSMNGRVLLEAIKKPENNFENVLSTFEISYSHEQSVTKRIYNLTDIATEEREHATISLLKWFIDEQVEEENNFSTLIRKLKRIGNDSAALYMLDAELATRVFVPIPVV